MTSRIFNSYYRRSPLMTGNECNVTCRTRVVPKLTFVSEGVYTATYPYFTLCDIMLPQYTQITFWRCRHRCVDREFGPPDRATIDVYYDVINMVGDLTLIPTGWEPNTGAYPINIQRVTGSLVLSAAAGFLNTPIAAEMGEKGSTVPLVLGQSAYFRATADGTSLGLACGPAAGFITIETSVEMGFR